MKKVGIVLVCLQILVLVGGVANGTLMGMLASGTAGIFELIGYLLPGIIGLILINRAKKKEQK